MLPSPPQVRPTSGGDLGAHDGFLRGGMEARGIKLNQGGDVDPRQRGCGHFIARRKRAPEAVELLWRVEVKEFAQMRVVAGGRIESAQEKAAPDFLLVLQQRDRRRQAEIVAEAVEQPDAETVDRAEEGLPVATGSEGYTFGPFLTVA